MTAGSVTVTTAPIGGSGDWTTLVTLTNSSGMAVRFMGRGGIILSIMVPDRKGVLADVVLGFDDLERYENDRFYFGALVGRYANRIAGAQFRLDDRHYALTMNSPPHHLHGGTRGFTALEWEVEPFDRDDAVGATLSLESPAGDQGYPGLVRARVTYLLTNDNAFVITYSATVDEATPVNLTQHSYFNLSGVQQANILDHELAIHASAITPVDATLIPTGELQTVGGTAFDFRSARRIGSAIRDGDEQLRFGLGYDHNFVLDAGSVDIPASAAELYHRDSGRVLEIRTTEPGLQLYTGNEVDQVRFGKGGPYQRHAGVALETQHFPDSPNRPEFPSTVVRPDQVYASETVYQFSVRPEDSAYTL